MPNSPYVAIPISEKQYDLDSIRRRSPEKTIFDSSAVENSELPMFDISASENSQFIKVFGRISNQMKEVENAILTQDQNRIRKKPEAPDELVDVIDAKETEEPFTLESFNDLVRMHLEKNKDFILARVTTIDNIDPNRFYYSYYAAHHINKVLFRKQPELGLLHRMQAKNPLNNMTIVGDVHYYVIKRGSPTQNSKNSPSSSKLNDNTTYAESALERILSPAIERILGYSQERKKNLNFNPQLDSFQVKKTGRSNSTASSRRNSADDAAVIKMTSPDKEHMQKDDFGLHQTTKKYKDLAYTNVRSVSYQNDTDGVNSVTEWMRIHTQHEANRAKGLISKSKSDVSTPIVKECSWEAHYFASDDDFLLDSKIRAYFKENALEKDDSVLFAMPASTAAHFTDGTQNRTGDSYVLTYRDSSGNLHGIPAKTVRLFLILFLLVGVILIRLFVPPHLIFLGIALLLLSFCLLLLAVV